MNPWPWVSEHSIWFPSSSYVDSTSSYDISAGVDGWNEVDNIYIFTMSFPETPKDEIKVLLEGRIISIIVKRSYPVTQTGLHVQKHNSIFTGRTRLPTNANADTVKATFNNSVLTVTVDKERGARIPNRRFVEITSDE